MNPTTPMPLALQAITTRLGFACKGPQKVGSFDTYEIDLASWNLSLTDATPCIWVKAKEFQSVAEPQLADMLRDVIREQRWQNETVFVFVDGECQILRRHLPKVLPTFVLFDATQQRQIQQTDSPTATTLGIMLKQLPRLQLAPYETTRPVTGGRFFGRQNEINTVLQNPQASYLFVGIRRIGKTSLLKEIKRHMDRIDSPASGQIRRLYVDCTVITSTDEFLQTITQELDPFELKLLMRRATASKRYQASMFARFASLHGAPVTFLIDELDRLLTSIGDEKRLFDALRAAATKGYARFIMAGFRRALNASTNQGSPLYNLGTTKLLGRMKRSEVSDMVLLPLERLRIHIQNADGIISRINLETAGLPNYIQYYCHTLLEYLDEQQQDLLVENDLQAVYENREFQNFVLETFMSNTELLERALVYALLQDEEDNLERRSFSQRTMNWALDKRKLPVTATQLEHACQNLEIAGVFEQVGRDYRFAVPILQRLLHQKRDINFLFEKARDEILSSKLHL